MNDLHAELKTLIVTSLSLADITPEEVSSSAPLFGDGLGLDSVDALELAISIHKKYGIKINAEDPEGREAFGSVDALAAYIKKRQG